jgi:transcriptional regulator with XRE-family HTH domain
MNVGSLIRTERQAKGKTLAEIADALAVSPNTVWELEKQNRGSMATLERICEFLGLEWVRLPAGRSLERFPISRLHNRSL